MIPVEFNPPLSHEYYFIRHALLEAVTSNATQLQGKMMDFGCGSKPYQSVFGHLTEYIGVDYDGEGHSHAHESIDVFYDGKTIPFQDQTFDSVLCSEVFEHLFELEAILKEVNRVMKPGGKMLVTCPFAWNLHESPVDYARYTPFALEQIFAKAGFKIISQQKKGNYYQTLHQLKNVFYLGALFGKYDGKGYQWRSALHFLRKPFFYIRNLKAKFCDQIVPKRWDYYLINVFVVEKI